MPIQNEIRQPRPKLRSVNALTSTIGSSTLSTRQKKAIPDTPQTVAKIATELSWSHSYCGPSSSTYSSEPRKPAIKIRPAQSKRSSNAKSGESKLTIGPTVGGYITDAMSWHWLFFINIVPGIGITVGVLVLVDFDSPDFALLDRFDWAGLIFMAGFLGSLEYVLEEGPQYEWLQDTSVAVCAAICVVSAIAFFYR